MFVWHPRLEWTAVRMWYSQKRQASSPTIIPSYELVMQSIECHYNVYNFARRAVYSAGMFKASISGRFGLTLDYERQIISWPNSRCSVVVVETRSISGLSPYNNRKTAERRASCEPRLQFIRHRASGQGLQVRTSVHFIQKRRTPQ